MRWSSLADFLGQGIPTQCNLEDPDLIKYILSRRNKMHDWERKFLLENVSHAEEYQRAKSAGDFKGYGLPPTMRDAFGKFRNKWDRLNLLHRYTGQK